MRVSACGMRCTHARAGEASAVIVTPMIAIASRTTSSEPIARGTRERSSRRTGGASISPNSTATSTGTTTPSAIEHV